MVVFEVYFFKSEYVEEVKQRELAHDPSLEDRYVPEIGGMFCLNTARPIAIRFFSIDEGLELISAGYQVSVESGQNEPLDLEQTEVYPEEMVDGIILELSGLFVGALIDDGKSQPFKNRKELEDLLTPLAAEN